MTLRPFLIVRDMDFSSGPKSSIEPVKSRASAPYRVGKGSPGMEANSATPLLPAVSASHSFSGELPSGETSPNPVMTTRRVMLLGNLAEPSGAGVKTRQNESGQIGLGKSGGPAMLADSASLSEAAIVFATRPGVES
jgi:hypothetical protein